MERGGHPLPGRSAGKNAAGEEGGAADVEIVYFGKLPSFLPKAPEERMPDVTVLLPYVVCSFPLFFLLSWEVGWSIVRRGDHLYW